MRALQLYYTSCKKGLSGSAGFQVRTCTPGIQPDEQREIVSQSGYHPPKNANPTPTREEIQRDFPRAFRFYVLKSNRWAITMSSYMTRDYSGRRGNLFAHTLMSEEEQPPMWPIDYYEWEGWNTFLPPEEDTDEMPPPLESVDVSKIPPAESFSFQELKDFLLEAPDRKPLLATMIRAIFLSPKDSRSIVIRDSHLNGLFWIACLQKAFPLACVTSLPFSAYQYGSRNCALINATTKGTDFLFNETEKKFQFYMFDLTTGLHSEVPEKKEDYAENIAEWMATVPQRLSTFHEFMTIFHDYSLDDTLLLGSIKLFSIAIDKAPVLTDEELSHAIDFGIRFVSSDGRERMIKLLDTAIEKLGHQIKLQDFERIIQFLAEATAATGKAEHQEITFKSWIRMFEQFLSEKQYDAMSLVLSARHSIGSNLDAFREELAELFLRPEFVGCLQAGVQKAPGNVLQIIYEETFDSLHVLGKVPLWTQNEVTALVKGMLSSPDELLTKLKHLFQAVEGEAETLSEICKMAALNIIDDTKSPSEKQTTTGRVLAHTLKDKRPDFATAVRKNLEDSKEYNILFGEWLQLLESQPDKHGTYDTYSRYVSKQFPQYWKSYEEQILSSYFNALPRPEQMECVSTWIKGEKLLKFPHQFACDCLQMANLSLSLDIKGKHPNKMAFQIEALSKKRGFSLQPNRPLLCKLMLRAQSENIVINEIPADRLSESLADLNEADYDLFLSSFLEPTLKKAKTSDQQEKVIEAVFIHKYAVTFRDNYLTLVKRWKLKDEWRHARDALLFWLRNLDAEEDLASAMLWEDLLPVFVKGFRKIDKTKLPEIDPFIRNDQKIGQRGLEAWNRFHKEVTERKRGKFFGLKLFGSKKQ